MMGRMDLVTLVVGVLATARLTRLVVADRVTLAPRAWVQQHGPGWAAYLVACSWCVSIYTGAGVAAALWAWDWSVWPLAALAFSYAAGSLAMKDGE